MSIVYFIKIKLCVQTHNEQMHLFFFNFKYSKKCCFIKKKKEKKNKAKKKAVHRESMMTQPSRARCIAHVGMVAMVYAEPQQPSPLTHTIPGHTNVWRLVTESDRRGYQILTAFEYQILTASDCCSKTWIQSFPSPRPPATQS